MDSVDDRSEMEVAQRQKTHHASPFDESQSVLYYALEESHGKTLLGPAIKQPNIVQLWYTYSRVPAKCLRTKLLRSRR